jgi:hypothetical protein
VPWRRRCALRGAAARAVRPLHPADARASRAALHAPRCAEGRPPPLLKGPLPGPPASHGCTDPWKFKYAPKLWLYVGQGALMSSRLQLGVSGHAKQPPIAAYRRRNPGLSVAYHRALPPRSADWGLDAARQAVEQQQAPRTQVMHEGTAIRGTQGRERPTKAGDMIRCWRSSRPAAVRRGLAFGRHCPIAALAGANRYL